MQIEVEGIQQIPHPGCDKLHMKVLTSFTNLRKLHFYENSYIITKQTSRQ
jgi:hypothetical protein